MPGGLQHSIGPGGCSEKRWPGGGIRESEALERCLDSYLDSDPEDLGAHQALHEVALASERVPGLQAWQLVWASKS